MFFHWYFWWSNLHRVCQQPSQFSVKFLFTENKPKMHSSVQSLSRVQLFVTPWTAVRQTSLSIILPHRETVFTLFFPHPVYVPHTISKWSSRPLSCSLYPRSKNGLRTPVQCWLSLELAGCSNSISHFNKLYFPLILFHVWKFFFNPHLDQDIHLSGNCSHPWPTW